MRCLNIFPTFFCSHGFIMRFNLRFQVTMRLMCLLVLAGGFRWPSGVRWSAAGSRFLGLRLCHAGTPQRLCPRLSLQQLDQHHHEKQLNAHMNLQETSVQQETVLTATPGAFVYMLYMLYIMFRHNVGSEINEWTWELSFCGGLSCHFVSNLLWS